nr:hypothetical protein [Salinigranum marinum]
MKEEGKIRYTPQYVAERCRELTKHDLLQHLGNGVYVITEKGEAYLAGDLDTGEVDEDGSGSERPASA